MASRGSGPSPSGFTVRAASGRPSGAAVERRGNLFVATGNGDKTSGFDFGNSVIRLSPKLKQTGFYRALRTHPSSTKADTDLGSVGPTLLGANRMFVIGKEGLGLMLSTTHLGGTGGELFARASALAAALRRARVPGPFVFVPCTDGLHALRISGNTSSPPGTRAPRPAHRSSRVGSSGRSTAARTCMATRRTAEPPGERRPRLGPPISRRRRPAVGACSRRRTAR